MLFLYACSVFSLVWARAVDDDIFGVVADPESDFFINQDTCGQITKNFIVGRNPKVESRTWPWVCSLGKTPYAYRTQSIITS